MKLTVAEKKWFERLQRTLDAAPKSLEKKGSNFQLSSFTIGDRDINVYDEEKLRDWQAANPRKADGDVGPMVDEAGALLLDLVFPFCIESTAG